MALVLKTNYFYGNEVSDYGKENGRVDYRTLSKAFDCVLNNDIYAKTDGVIGYWEQVGGVVNNQDEIDKLNNRIAELQDWLDWDIEDIDGEEREFAESQMDDWQIELDDLEEKVNELEDEQNELPEIFQWYIVSSSGADVLINDCGDEIVFYNEELDMYLWGVTHWGTSWDYVLTSIEIEKGQD